MKPDDIEAIARSATEKAIELGYSKLEDRLKFSVTKVSSETTTSWSSASAASLPNSCASQLIRPSVGETVALLVMALNVRDGGRSSPAIRGGYQGSDFHH